MTMSLLTGSLSAKVVGGLMKFKKIFSDNSSEYYIDREKIEGWSKESRERL